MSKPPVKLPIGTYMYHKSVLADMGHEVNHHLQVSIPCKRRACTGNIIAVFDDVFGVWYYCPSCGFAGDSLQLYALQENMSVSEAMTCRDSDIPDHVDRAVAQLYYSDWDDRRVLADPAKRWRPKYISAFAALQDAGLYAGHKVALNKFVGIMPRKYLKLHGIASPEFKSRDNILLPCFDAPGRLRSVIHLNAAQGPNTVGLKNRYINNKDEGVAFLDTVAGKNIETVYVIQDPLRAAIMQYRHYLTTGAVLPLIAVNRKISAVHCRYINAKYVVMVLDALTPGSVDAALTLRGRGAEVFIAHSRDLANPSSGGAYDMQAAEVLGIARHAATPAMQLLAACANAKARPGLPFNLLELSADAAQEYISDSSPRGSVQAVKDCTTLREVKVGRRYYVEKDDGVFVVHAGEMHMVSNVRIIPKWIVTIAGDKLQVYSGELEFGGERVPFAIRPGTVRHGSAEWIKGTLAAAGKDIAGVAFDPSGLSKVYRVAEQIHRPKSLLTGPILRSSEKENSITFPKLKVTGEGITDVYLADICPDAPCQYMSADWTPDKEELVKLLSDNDTNATYWAVMVYMIAAVIAPYYGKTPKSLIMYGSDNNVFDWYTAAFNLATQSLSYRAFRRQSRKSPGIDYGVPARITTPPDDDAFRRMLKTRQPVIAEGCEPVADALLALGGWLALDASNCGELKTVLTMSNVMPRVLHRLLAEDYKVPEDLLLHVASALHDWISEQGVEGQLTVLKCVDRIHSSTEVDQALLAVIITHAIMDYFRGDIGIGELSSFMRIGQKWVKIIRTGLPYINSRASSMPLREIRSQWTPDIDNTDMSRGSGMIAVPRAWLRDRIERAKELLKTRDPEIFQQCCNITLKDIRRASVKTD